MSNALSFSDEQAMILDSAREFCREKSPVSAVRALLDSEHGYDPGTWEEMVALGWPSLAIPEEFGGAGLGFGSIVPIAESMGRALLSTPLFSTTLAAQAILRAGQSAHKEQWLPQLAAGTPATLALLDGGDWGAPTTHCAARRDGDNIVLEGEKWFVADAGVAQLFVAWCELQGESALLLVNRDQLAADAIQPHTLLDETKRAARVSFNGVSVPAAQLLDGAGANAVLRDLGLLGALLVAAEATGSTGACLDTVVDYLKTRKQFGQLIGSYQALKHPTVEMLCQLDSARSLIYHAATLLDETEATGELDTDTEIACRMAKAQAVEALTFAGDRAVQFHGGMGFTYECDAQLYIRRAQYAQQQFGDAWHHRKRLAALLLDAA
ncbi:MAG: acyl-CoA dehydrogenase family protein [Halieaceae bacterium]|jgi:alkylation response protein AidB-like acyl-CoA dehydrogenase|nr:acyl-CoA dehydrogenase family protein [Halieaceae bacterium]